MSIPTSTSGPPRHRYPSTAVPAARGVLRSSPAGASRRGTCSTRGRSSRPPASLRRCSCGRWRKTRGSTPASGARTTRRTRRRAPPPPTGRGARGSAGRSRSDPPAHSRRTSWPGVRIRSAGRTLAARAGSGRRTTSELRRRRQGEQPRQRRRASREWRASGSSSTEATPLRARRTRSRERLARSVPRARPVTGARPGRQPDRDGVLHHGHHRVRNPASTCDAGVMAHACGRQSRGRRDRCRRDRGHALGSGKGGASDPGEQHATTERFRVEPGPGGGQLVGHELRAEHGGGGRPHERSAWSIAPAPGESGETDGRTQSGRRSECGRSPEQPVRHRTQGRSRGSGRQCVAFAISPRAMQPYSAVTDARVRRVRDGSIVCEIRAAGRRVRALACFSASRHDPPSAG